MRFYTFNKIFFLGWSILLLVSTVEYIRNKSVIRDDPTRVQLNLDGYANEEKASITHTRTSRSTWERITKSQFAYTQSDKSITGLSLKHSTPVFEILRWTKFDVYKREGNELFSKCEYSRCTMTSNFSRIDTADAVVMTAREISSTALELPKYHHFWQRWVFLAMEPPVKATITSQYNNIFNLTATFRDDADLHFKYLQTVPLPVKELDYVVLKDNYAAGKTRLVAWMVSNCDALNRSLDYVRELQKYVTVDVYGNCGPYKCVQRYRLVECRMLLDTSYKFYLAFENGICLGYLTEKIWAALTGNVLPIVMGGADYAKYLPPDSYLDIRNFSSPEKLATYMKELNENDVLYNNFFEWKRSFKLLEERTSPHWCELCKYLHSVNKTSTYPELYKWYNGCIEPDVYYKGVADMLIANQ